MSPVLGLLGLLIRSEQHGYELKRIVDQSYAPFWQIDYAQLYRSLARLVKDGLAHAEREPGVRGPERKVYRITSRGRRAFAAWLGEPARDPAEILLKWRLAFEAGMAGAVAPLESREVLQRERDRRLDALAAARAGGAPLQIAWANSALREIESALASLDLMAALLPSQSDKTATDGGPLLIAGSDDPLLARLAESVHASARVVGSLDGLLALARHQADVAGVHLLDVQSGEYNLPFVRHFLPEERIVLVNLAFRENGLMLAPGNPKRIKSVRDLARPDVRLINRQRGAGSRLLLAARLRAAHIDPQALPHWERTVGTHGGVAAAILSGTADAGPGLRAVADEWGLDFILLGEERFDLVMSEGDFDSIRVSALLQALHDRTFREPASKLHGYDLSESGRILARVH